MLHRLIVRNFKRFDDVEIELGQTVLLIGPNNSGKTTTLQALALWDLGLRRWHEKRGDKPPAKQRQGVAINRRDLVTVPVPEAGLFWRDRHLRRTVEEDGKKKTENIRIEIEVSGVRQGEKWTCGLEFDFANSESIYCRPIGVLGRDRESPPPFMPKPALDSKIAFLPPMSGLSANETRLDQGAIQVRLGEGRTAEVLRNLCHQIYEADEKDRWHRLNEGMRRLFGVTLDAPRYVPERGEIAMSYQDRRGVSLDLSAAGRGLQQTLLLLAYLHMNPGAVLLLDEPDAHLEILRQRQIYQTLTDLAQEQDSQLIAASHSEVLLNEAADRDVVVAFVGTPHRIDDRGAQVAKSLKSIGFEAYYQAEQVGWVLYLEGSTDLAILRALAEKLDHPAARALERPFVHYVGNQISKAREHFFGLRESKEDLVGVAILDRQDPDLSPESGPLEVATWRRRETENYITYPQVLVAYAASLAGGEGAEELGGPLFALSKAAKWRELMTDVVQDHVPPAALRDLEASWWKTVKASDEFLDVVFEEFFRRAELPNLMRKSDYHQLARFIDVSSLDREVAEKLDLIVVAESRASPSESVG